MNIITSFYNAVRGWFQLRKRVDRLEKYCMFLQLQLVAISPDSFELHAQPPPGGTPQPQAQATPQQPIRRGHLTLVPNPNSSDSTE